MLPLEPFINRTPRWTTLHVVLGCERIFKCKLEIAVGKRSELVGYEGFDGINLSLITKKTHFSLTITLYRITLHARWWTRFASHSNFLDEYWCIRWPLSSIQMDLPEGCYSDDPLHRVWSFFADLLLGAKDERNGKHIANNIECIAKSFYMSLNLEFCV